VLCILGLPQPTTMRCAAAGGNCHASPEADAQKSRETVPTEGLRDNEDAMGVLNSRCFVCWYVRFDGELHGASGRALRTTSTHARR
jgi:hypothetical protein